MIDAKDKYALTNVFPEECKRLPIGYLEEHEKELVEKCINKKEFTDEELNELQILLDKYRKYFTKYDSVEIEENIEANVKVIKSSTELLSLLDDPNRYRFDMHVKVNNEILRLEFRLKPLSDSDYIELVDVQTRVFRDLDKNEKLVYSKATNEIPLSPEEEKMVQNIQDKIIEKMGDIDKNTDYITNFLINHVELVDDADLTKAQRKKFWNVVDPGVRTLIYNRCREIVRVDDDLEVDLFPDVR